MLTGGQNLKRAVFVGESDIMPHAADPEQINEAWNTIRSGLRRDLGARVFNQWLRAIVPGSFCADTGTLDLLAPSAFVANYIASNFGQRLRLAWRAMDLDIAEVRVVRNEAAAEMIEVAPVQPADQAAAAQQTAQRSGSFEPRHGFESFVTDESNALACSAARAMAQIEAPAFNPLFIHGATGLGKTHLLHAIAGQYQKLHGSQVRDGDILYMSAERFMTEFITAIRANDTMTFKARLRAARLLLIDDIQFIAGKGPTQEEFLHTVNALIDAGARIAIAADRAPQQLGAVDPRILSRLAGGLVADIQQPSLDLRYAVLRARQARALPIIVPDEVLDLLARSIRASVRELEGAFNKLLANAQLRDMPITLELAQTLLSDTLRASTRRITIDEIQKACAAHYRIDAAEMRSKRRAVAVARPRQIAMYLAKKLTPRSLPEIGRIFGGRDHTTVIHAIRRIEEMRSNNPDMDADIRAIQQRLES
jgi:chromosomal replication initiator protein